MLNKNDISYIYKFFYFCILNGALAQLARVLDWQSRGHGFDSHTLHFA